MREFIEDCTGSAVSFVIKLLVLGLIVASLAGTFAYQISLAQANTSVAGNATLPGVPGGPALLGIIVLLFFIVPVALFAKAIR